MKKREIKIIEMKVEQLQNLFGANDQNLKLLELKYGVKFNFNDEKIYFECEDKVFKELNEVFETLFSIAKKDILIEDRLLIQICTLANSGELSYFNNLHTSIICKNRYGKSISPKTLGQL